MRRDKVKTAAAKKKSRREDKKNTGARALTRQRRSRQRKWLTFVRMCRYGVNNFTRNAWLTIAATAVMTITLLIIFVTVVAGNILKDSISEMQKRIDLTIYVRTNISVKDVDLIKTNLKKLSNTESVEYISPEKGHDILARANKEDNTALRAIEESTNRLPGSFNITLKNINDTSQLRKFVETDTVYLANRERKPSFVKKRDTIQRLVDWSNVGRRVGGIMSAIFVVISSLIIFNTIRMAIFSRKDEIEMMKLIGADKSFIRGPFVVEAIVYGFISGIIATVVGVIIMYMLKDSLVNFGVVVIPTINLMINFAGLVVLAMVVSGGVIGTISALLATRRYLKI